MVFYLRVNVLAASSTKPQLEVTLACYVSARVFGAVDVRIIIRCLASIAIDHEATHLVYIRRIFSQKGTIPEEIQHVKYAESAGRLQKVLWKMVER